ncbi:hypothetical protein [Streptomyces sp. WMMC905]|uniref:hypothetical protein n=1 Tax=Streptomyces sp. WMMC905 TaxID=3404123 RepID=UPI003B929D1D
MTIRLTHAVVLARMLLVFFRRRVLGVGALDSRPVRALLAVAVVLLLGILCATAYLFLRPLADDAAVWRLMFDTATVSVVLWVQIAFLLVKVLFVNAEGLLGLSYQLPVTNRERAAAFLVYEVTMTAIVAGAGAVSLVAVAPALLGPSAVGYITASLVLPVLLTYLVLSVLYQALTRLWMLVGFGRTAGLLNILALFLAAVLYSTRVTPMIRESADAYLEHRTSHAWVSSVSWAWHTYGPWPTLAVSAVVAFGLTALALGLTPNQHVRQSRFLNIPGGRRLRGLLGPYDWCLLRASQTAVSAAMAVAVFVYLLLRSTVNPMWSLAALSFGGLYHFTATQPLRMMPGARVSAWRVYGRLIRAQLLLLAAFAVPGLALTLALGVGGLAPSAAALAGCVGGAVVTTCVGIVFPAERDNPFSVFLGLCVATITLALFMIGLGLLGLPPWAVTGGLVGASALFVRSAVRSIHTSESRRRNDQGTVGREGRSRRSPVDIGDRDAGPARADVLDRN